MEIQRPRDWRGVSLVAIMHVEEPRAIWSLYHCHKVHFTQSARTDSLVRIDLSADAQLFHANGHFGAGLGTNRSVIPCTRPSSTGLNCDAVSVPVFHHRLQVWSGGKIPIH